MREEIINELMGKDKRYISGEEISHKLNVSRTAVWKHIKALKDMGYIIESKSKSGYKLLQVPDYLYPQHLKMSLRTKVLGNEIKYFSEIASTNDEAKRLAANGLDEGTTVVSEMQTKGKGRRSRFWVSPYKDGIFFSFILKPKILPASSSVLTMVLATAVRKSLSSLFEMPFKIKWPNDILINEKKICGILLEMDADMETINYIIAGIGINANNQSFPEELRSVATSLRIETGNKVDRIKVLSEVLNNIDTYYDMFTNGRLDEILKEWKKNSNVINKNVRIHGVENVVKGKAIDIDKDGGLIIKKDDGKLEKIISGDVSLRLA